MVGNAEAVMAMYIARLQVSGVRGFHGDRSVDLDFARPDGSYAGWTVVAGRNSSGKSTLLQAMALVLSGPRATGFLPSFANWMTSGATTADMTAILHISKMDSSRPAIFDEEPKVWMNFVRGRLGQDRDPSEPKFEGAGLDSLSRDDLVTEVTPTDSGWFYAGYGPFRHLGRAGGSKWRSRKSMLSKLSLQVSSLFDESVSLSDAVDWLIQQRLYQLEGRPGATEFLDAVMALLGDGLLPDGYRVAKVDSDGLWVSQNGSEFPLREMSDGYRAVTALVVDIVRQMNVSYRGVRIEYREGKPTLPYPGVVLIDEVDAHLHISWQKVIGTWLKEHFPRIQFIVTSHSPYICQSADPGGLILLPGPGEAGAPRVLGEQQYERVVYGSGDDAILTELFGVATPYSRQAEHLRRRLGELEMAVLGGTATQEELDEFKLLSDRLSSSLTARADEVAARFGRGL